MDASLHSPTVMSFQGDFDAESCRYSVFDFDYSDVDDFGEEICFKINLFSTYVKLNLWSKLNDYVPNSMYLFRLFVFVMITLEHDIKISEVIRAYD